VHNKFHTCHQAVFCHHGPTGFDQSMQPFRTYSDYSRVRQCILLYTMFLTHLSVNSRGAGTIIKVGLSAAKKKYAQDDRAACVQHLQENVDVLMQYYVNNNVHGSVVYLQLKGVDIFPCQGQEVLAAVACIL